MHLLTGLANVPFRLSSTASFHRVDWHHAETLDFFDGGNADPCLGRWAFRRFGCWPGIEIVMCADRVPMMASSPDRADTVAVLQRARTDYRAQHRFTGPQRQASLGGHCALAA